MNEPDGPAILTPDRRLRVFVSSTLDLTAERAAARRAVEDLHLTPVLFEAGARPHPPRALYQAYVAQSDVFVAVYAQRYGWTAPGMRVSGLEDEFELSAGKPRLVYLRSDDEREPRLDQLLHRVRDAGLSYKRFASAAELEALLRDDLTVLLTERFHAAEVRPRRRRSPAVPPVPPTEILGRRSEVSKLRRWLVDDDVRLATLVGPGGVGKTRLAVEVAREATSDFPGGVFFVPLASVREPDLVADAIAAALDVTTGDGAPAVEAVAGVIGREGTLLVLDNLEHVVAGAATVAELLERCEHLRVIATSRAPLRLRAERLLAVSPLAVPSAAGAGAQTEQAASVRLFVRAAQAVRPDFALDAGTAETVLAVCRELDGLPLAIELAAATLAVLTPEMLLGRLRAGLPDLPGGPRDLPPRHRRLSDTIAWSHDLLDATAQEGLAQLSVFRGGFTLESAAAVCDLDTDVLGVVATLVEHSLVRAEISPGQGARFSMLGTVRQYAAARLDDRPHHDAVAARHAATFVELAEAVGRPGGRQRDRLDLLEQELDNVRRAFDWSLAAGRVDSVAGAVWQSWWFWWMRGHLAEGARWADRCLAVTDLDRVTRARVLTARGLFAVWAGAYELAVPAFTDAAQIARDVGDERTLAYTDVALGVVSGLTTDVPRGLAMIRRGTTAFARADDEVGVTTGLAAASWVQGITRHFDDTDERLGSALRRARDAGSDVDVGIIEGALAQLALTEGHQVRAVDLAEASLEHLAAAGHIASTILALEVVAELGVAAGAPRTPALVLGATAAIRAGMGTRVPPQAAARLRRLLATGRDRSGAAFDDAYAGGAGLGFTGAVDHGRLLLAELRQRAPAGC